MTTTPSPLGPDSRPTAESTLRDAVSSWFAGRLPDGWFDGPVEVAVDREEIVVTGGLAAPAAPGDDLRAAESGRIGRFREETRDQRITIAREAERAFGRKVAWGARCGETRQLFTSLSVPVMTRLRQPERHVLDTLVESGVARSRSDALGWAVRLVGQHADSWLAQLRAAMEDVRRVRADGPDLDG